MRSKHLIILGYGVFLSQFSALVILGLYQVNTVHNQIQSIVAEHNAKTKLISQMVWHMRERGLRLHNMIASSDTLERDRIFSEFKAQTTRFTQARADFVRMPLSMEEKALLAEQSKANSLAAPLQKRVIEYIRTGKPQRAQRLLLNSVMPLQESALQALLKLQGLQQDNAKNIARENELSILNSSMMGLIILLMSLTISALIAYLVMRRISNTEKNLQREKNLAQITLHSLGDAVITTNEQGMISDINPVACNLTGRSKLNAMHSHIDRILKIVQDDNKDIQYRPVSDAIENNSIVLSKQDAILINRKGKEFAIEFTATPISDQDGRVYGGIIVFRDVTPLRSLAYQLTYQASHDGLTGLLNRREFEVRLEQAINNAKNEDIVYALCYLDLDQFKLINDTCGHVAGDEYLKQAASCLKASLRESDVLARVGGDAFAILLEACTLGNAEKIADKIREKIKGLRFVWGDKSFDTGVSIGVVPLHKASGNLSDLLSAADTACYEAKEQGRNRIHVYQENDAKLEKRRGEMHWVHRITDALDKDRFVLYHQRIVASDRRHEPGHYYEILVRIINEDGSIVLPSSFIPAAERYNLMPVIDKMVIEKTLIKLQDLSTLSTNVRFSINISGQSLCDNHFMEFVITSVANSDIPPESLIFEITETATIANFSRANRFIKSLKDIGCQFALDDFGSGLSSFSYLKNIPVDYLKIDGYFVRDMHNDPTNYALVESINQIGNVMGIKTVAEHVENEQTFHKLRAMGVNFCQGYYFGKPQPLDKFSLDQDDDLQSFSA